MKKILAIFILCSLLFVSCKPNTSVTTTSDESNTASVSSTNNLISSEESVITSENTDSVSLSSSSSDNTTSTITTTTITNSNTNINEQLCAAINKMPEDEFWEATTNDYFQRFGGYTLFFASKQISYDSKSKVLIETPKGEVIELLSVDRRISDIYWINKSTIILEVLGDTLEPTYHYVEYNIKNKESKKYNKSIDIYGFFWMKGERYSLLRDESTLAAVDLYYDNNNSSTLIAKNIYPCSYDGTNIAYQDSEYNVYVVDKNIPKRLVSSSEFMLNGIHNNKLFLSINGKEFVMDCNGEMTEVKTDKLLYGFFVNGDGSIYCFDNDNNLYLIKNSEITPQQINIKDIACIEVLGNEMYFKKRIYTLESGKDTYEFICGKMDLKTKVQTILE